MIQELDGPATTEASFGALRSEIRVRVLNCSATGCLVETTRTVPVGTIAAIRITLAGREFSEHVRVVRCQPLQGAGSVYHVGMEFLSMTPPFAGSLRYLMKQGRATRPARLNPGESN